MSARQAGQNPARFISISSAYDDARMTQPTLGQ
jgi:hypothetical protein